MTMRDTGCLAVAASLRGSERSDDRSRASGVFVVGFNLPSS